MSAGLKKRRGLCENRRRERVSHSVQVLERRGQLQKFLRVLSGKDEKGKYCWPNLGEQGGERQEREKKRELL